MSDHHQALPLNTKATRALAERFWPKVNKLSKVECWLWTAGKAKFGYGRIHFGTRNQSITAHRASWLISHGHLPNLHVLHRCDTPSCVNPHHLFLGTQQDNLADMYSKGRNVSRRGAKGEKNPGAKITAEIALKIREMYATGKYTQEALGKIFGLTQWPISAIVRRRTWSHVP